jgi:uncharacterized membrane protein
METGGDDHETQLKTVYIPTNLIYFGDIALFRDEHIFYTDIAIEDGIKIILSGGIATPSKLSGVKG